MIVCICRRLNEDKISEALEAGAACPNSIMKHHGTRFNCGRCRDEMRDILAQRNEADLAAHPVAAE